MTIHGGTNRSQKSRHANATHHRTNSEQRNPVQERKHRWTYVAIPCAALVLCLALPVTLIARWFLKSTIDAGRGYKSPSLAVQAYFLNTALGGPLAGTEVEYNLFCDRRDDALHQQTLDLVNAAKRPEIPGHVAFDRVDEHPTTGTTTFDGDRAIYTTQATWGYTNIHRDRMPGDWMWWRSNPQPWTFELINDNGWRICAATPPDPCTADSGIQCEPPTVQPSAAPLITKTWDTTVPYRCLPDRPYRDLENGCPTPPPGWTAPGPYYCAPDQPFGIPNHRKDECEALGWT